MASLLGFSLATAVIANVPCQFVRGQCQTLSVEDQGNGLNNVLSSFSPTIPCSPFICFSPSISHSFTFSVFSCSALLLSSFASFPFFLFLTNSLFDYLFFKVVKQIYPQCIPCAVVYHSDRLARNSPLEHSNMFSLDWKICNAVYHTLYL